MNQRIGSQPQPRHRLGQAALPDQNTQESVFCGLVMYG
jgi:hypothetical protein